MMSRVLRISKGKKEGKHQKHGSLDRRRKGDKNKKEKDLPEIQ